MKLRNKKTWEFQSPVDNSEIITDSDIEPIIQEIVEMDQVNAPPAPPAAPVNPEAAPVEKEIMKMFSETTTGAAKRANILAKNYNIFANKIVAGKAKIKAIAETVNKDLISLQKPRR